MSGQMSVLSDIIMTERRERVDSSLSIVAKENNNRQSLLGAMDTFLQTIDRMDDTVMMPSRLLDLPMSHNPDEVFHNSKSGKKASHVSSGTPSTDLYTFYTMLKTIRSDLVSGTTSSTTNEEDPDDSGRDSVSETSEGSECSKMDEETNEVAAAFKYHLSGLFSTLGRLSEGAEYLTAKYQDQINMDAGKMS